MINKKIFFSFKAIILILSFFYIYKQITLENILNILLELNFYSSTIIIVFVLIFSLIFFQSLRYKQIHNFDNQFKISIRKSIFINSLANLAGEITFLLSYFTKFLLFNNEVSKLRRFLILIFEKLSSFCVLILLSAVSIIFVDFYIVNHIFNFKNILFIILILFFSLLFVFYFRNIIIENFNKIFSLIKLNQLLYIIINSFIIQSISILIYLNIIFFLGLDFNVFNFLLLLPLATLISALPVSISNFGYREAVFIFVYNVIGIESEFILIVSILNSISIILVSFFLSLIFFKN